MGRQREGDAPPGRPSGKHQPPSERESKVCLTCGLPFTWRKKWARDWATVKYCSERCRRG